MAPHLSTQQKLDFSRADFKPLQEHEVNGLDYRYVNSDKARLSVVVQGIENGSASLLDAKGELHAYYHTDYLGTTDYLTSAVNSKVISWTSYSEWGEITHNAVLKCGQRELDLVKEYATHDFDAVLNMYYAKARFYDADNRRFVAFDPILDPSGYDLRQYVMEPMALVQYLYVSNNAVNWIDLLGLVKIDGLDIPAITGKDIGADGSQAYIPSILLEGMLAAAGAKLSSPLSKNQQNGIFAPTRKTITATYQEEKYYFNALATYVGEDKQLDYFVSLACYEKALGIVGKSANITEKNVMFRSSDYTGERGEADAMSILWSLLLTGQAKTNSIFGEKTVQYRDHSFAMRDFVRAYQAALKFKRSGPYLEVAGTVLAAAASAGVTASAYPPAIIVIAGVPIPIQGVAFAGHFVVNLMASTQEGVMPDAPTNSKEALAGVGSIVLPKVGHALDDAYASEAGRNAESAAAKFLTVLNSQYLFLLEEPKLAECFAGAVQTQSNNFLATNQAGFFQSYIPDYINGYNKPIQNVISLNSYWETSVDEMEKHIDANIDQNRGKLSQETILSLAIFGD